MATRTVLIADDHPLFRDALKVAVSQAAPDAEIIEAETVAAALEAAAANDDLALVLLDLRMPDAQGYSGIAQLHAERPATPILVVTGVEQAEAPRLARHFGAVGFVPKALSLSDISTSIARALKGETLMDDAPLDSADLQDMAARIASLTPTQLKVLLGVLAGKLNKQIAYELDVAEATIKAHMTAILRKLNVLNRTQAALAMRALEIEPETLAS